MKHRIFMMNARSTKKCGLMKGGEDFALWLMKNAISTKIDIVMSVMA